MRAGRELTSKKLAARRGHYDTEGIIMDWRHSAACRDEDPELFYPTGNSGPALEQIERAKTVCRRCFVTFDCLNWAIEMGIDSGVWGGMSEDERRELKRKHLAPSRVGSAR
jgi:WhiB family transcriptional regulator, redox-sensing transcriptional regulator